MSLGQRIRDARISHKYTQNDIALKLGVRHNTVSNWEKNKSMPDPTTLEKLCQLLKVTPNYLLRGQLETSELSDFSYDEVSFILKYRKLSQQAQGAVAALVDYYHTSVAIPFPCTASSSGHINSQISSAPLSIAGKISIQSVAAGTGTYLDDDDFESICVIDNAATRKASYFVPVSGNSMEPRYYDGDVLIVADDPVNQGEIGIFTLDNQGYVKQLGNSQLISLNKDFAPIPMNENIRCNGKVIGVLKPDWILPE